MAKYLQKPVEIEAIQFKLIEKIPCKHGTAKKYNDLEIAEFMDKVIRVKTKPDGSKEGKIEIETLEGEMIASVGDYIIKGIDGEFYTYKPEIFHKIYEKSEPVKVCKCPNCGHIGGIRDFTETNLGGEMFNICDKCGVIFKGNLIYTYETAKEHIKQLNKSSRRSICY